MSRTRTARRRLALSVVGALALAGTLAAQAPPAAAPALPPLLYLRIAGPDGMKLTVFRGEPHGVAFNTPCIIGVRPGYSYRMSLSNIPGFPGATFAPTIDARGSLWLAGQLRNADFPATIHFREEDFAKIEQGALIKKVVVLENPETAEPVRATADRPIEVFVGHTRNLDHEIQDRGAPLAVVHLGQRTLTTEELAASAIRGTLLAPGEKALPTPRVAPWVPWACYPLFDPLHGPASVGALTTVYDGGDHRNPAGYDGAGRFRGLDPSDTVAEYVDSKGRPKVVASNRIALCVPRYVILRSETGLASQTVAFGPGSTHSATGGNVVAARLPFLEHTQPLHLEAAANRAKTSGVQFTAGTALTGRINGVEISANLQAPGTLDLTCPPPASPAGPERPVRIIKWPDKKGCNVGDLVMFSLRYTNMGSQPVTNVVVSDNLTPRLEYVPGSQKADRETRFTVQPNEVGSSILRWEFPAALQPGDSGLITFQVRVR